MVNLKHFYEENNSDDNFLELNDEENENVSNYCIFDFDGNGVEDDSFWNELEDLDY